MCFCGSAVSHWDCTLIAYFEIQFSVNEFTCQPDYLEIKNNVDT